MRKLVIGIIAVVCVQFIFVHFMVLQTPMELTIAPVESDVEVGKLDRDEFDEATDPAETIIRQEVAVSRDNGKTARPMRVRVEAAERPENTYKPSITRSQKPQFDPERLQVASPDDFKTVVISYNRDSAIPNCEPREVPQPKGRSYIAKSVLKKPWNLIKNIGAKFN